MHGGGREAHGASALHGLGEPQAVPAPVQASRGQQPAGEWRPLVRVQKHTDDTSISQLKLTPLLPLKAR